MGHDGKPVPVKGEITTVAPTKVVDGGFQLADGQTVGIAAPIIIQFDAPIADKAAVERALKVTTEPPVEGSWAWLPDEVGGARVHWRSREYYPAGTKVNVDAKLYGLAFGDGAYGKQDMSLKIDIGRRQVVKAEVSSHRIQVVRDEGVIMDFPCSYGEADKARNVTRNGIHVVSEKYSDFYMSNPAAGYNHIHERWAVRISNNGEFIHANPNSAGAQGNTNVTNGCINLSTSDAEQYFGSAIYGDPVEVTGSTIELSYSDGDIWDWAVPWDTWVGMSALPPSVGSQAGAGVDSAQRSGHSARCADAVGHPDYDDRPCSDPAVEPAGRRLIARPDDDLVEVDVRRPRRHEADHLGDVARRQRRDPAVDGVGALLIAVEAHQRELRLDRPGRNLGEPHRFSE